MADSRFFRNNGPVSLEQLAKLTGAVATSASGASPTLSQAFSDVAPLDQAGPEHISFLDNTKYIAEFAASKAGVCFVRQKFAERAPEGMLLLITEEPYAAFAIVSGHLYPDQKTSEISPLAVIAKTATIGKNCSIGPGTVIGDGVVIGDDCSIGALCTISHTIMGARVRLHRGIHIGQDGFGFAPSAKGILKVPQLGRVIIGNDVEIGSGTCIDRGAGPDTVIGDHSKIDNLVQIGHNVQIGKYVVIAAQCGIAGSTHIGDGAMLGGQVGLSGHIKIGAKAKLAAQAGVMGDVPAGATYGGSPAVPIMDWHRQTAKIAKLVRNKKDE